MISRLGVDNVGNFVLPEDEKFRMACYLAGDTDKVCAEKCCITADSFCGWRTRRGLKPNGGTGHGGLRVNNKRHVRAFGGLIMATLHQQLTKEQKEHAVELRRKKYTYKMIAEESGLEISLIKYRFLEHLKGV